MDSELHQECQGDTRATDKQSAESSKHTQTDSSICTYRPRPRTVCRESLLKFGDVPQKSKVSLARDRQA